VFVFLCQNHLNLFQRGVSDRLRNANRGADLIGCCPGLTRFREVQNKIRDRLDAHGRGDGHKLSEHPQFRPERRFEFRPGALATFAPAVYAAGCGVPRSKRGLHCQLNPAVTSPSFSCCFNLEFRAGLAARSNRRPERD